MQQKEIQRELEERDIYRTSSATAEGSVCSIREDADGLHQKLSAISATLERFSQQVRAQLFAGLPAAYDPGAQSSDVRPLNL